MDTANLEVCSGLFGKETHLFLSEFSADSAGHCCTLDSTCLAQSCAVAFTGQPGAWVTVDPGPSSSPGSPDTLAASEVASVGAEPQLTSVRRSPHMGLL